MQGLLPVQYVVQRVSKGPPSLRTEAAAAARIRKTSAECQLVEAVGVFLLLNSTSF